VRHLAVKAASATTDRGTFSALAAAYPVDRQGERIAKGAFQTSISRCEDSNKNIPVHWQHSASAEDIIGYVDPATMRETDEGLVVRGQLDLEDSEVARQAWRSMKNNSIGLSFGFLTVDSHDDDGVRVLDEVDLFEITLTPSPANADTRITEMKSVPDAVPSLDELKSRFDRATKDIDLRPPPKVVTFDA
jgi:uncharacterized protein